MYLWKQFKSKTEKGKVYSTGIEINDKGEVINYTCSCYHGSVGFWTKKNVAIYKTICKHILSLIAKTSIVLNKKLDLPDHFKTEENIKKIERFIKSDELVSKCNLQHLLYTQVQLKNLKSEKNSDLVKLEAKTPCMEKEDQKCQHGKAG